VGVGFVGGRWNGGSFAYNTAVNNVNVTVVHNTYNETVINNNVSVTKVSYNGGAGGTAAAPTPQERAAMQQPHIAPTPAQIQHRQQALQNPALAARANGGKPPIAATPRPAAFSGPGVVGAHGSGGPAAAAAIAARAAPAPSVSHTAPPVAPGFHPQQQNAARPQATQAPPPGNRPNTASPIARPAQPRPAAKPEAQRAKPQPEKREPDRSR
jgi:hypothetical protein